MPEKIATEPPQRYALADHERMAVAIRALQEIKDRTSGDDDLYEIHRAARDALSTINAREK